VAITFLDPTEAAAARSLIVTNGGTSDERVTEMWDGREVVPPAPNDEHAELITALTIPLWAGVVAPGLGRLRGPINVSDRAAGWRQNYRNPDLAAYLNANPAVNHGSHWQGGPDFLVEILSPGEDPYDKFAFYAGVGTQEVLLVFRDPWAIELHGLRGGRLELIGRSEAANGVILASTVLPLSFRLRVGTPRPAIAVTHTSDGRTWTA
jgi:hypothetical protein